MTIKDKIFSSGTDTLSPVKWTSWLRGEIVYQEEIIFVYKFKNNKYMTTEEIEKAAIEYANCNTLSDSAYVECKDGFIAGASYVLSKINDIINKLENNNHDNIS